MGGGGGEKLVGIEKKVGIEKVGRKRKVGNKFFWVMSLRGLCNQRENYGTDVF